MENSIQITSRNLNPKISKNKLISYTHPDKLHHSSRSLRQKSSEPATWTTLLIPVLHMKFYHSNYNTLFLFFNLNVYLPRLEVTKNLPPLPFEEVQYHSVLSALSGAVS